MANAEELMGLGMSPFVAAKLGADTSAVTGVGTTQAGAGQILTKSAYVTPTTGQTAAVIATASAGLMDQFYIYNNAATAVSALIFVPSGHTLAGSLNGSVTVPQGKSVILWQYLPKFWAYNLSM